MLPPISLFDRLSEKARDALEAAASTRKLARDETLIEEGEGADEIYVVLSGRVAILKRSGGGEHAIDELGPSEPIGEVAFFDRRTRSATVRALEATTVLVLPYDAVRAAPEIALRLGERLAERLRRSSADEADDARRRVVMGELVVKVIVLLSGYAMLLAALPRFDLGTTSTTVISLPLIALFGWGSWRFIKKTGYPLAQFGLGFRNFFGSLLEAIVVTPIAGALLAGLKWVAMRAHEPWRELPLFEHPDVGARLTEPTVVKLLVVYLVSSGVQELIVRSALQSSLEGFLAGARKRGTVIFVCALVFAVNHLHMAFSFAAAAFFPGLLWGLLFARRRNLVGPVLSHFALGGFVFFVLGVSLP